MFGKKKEEEYVEEKYLHESSLSAYLNVEGAISVKVNIGFKHPLEEIIKCMSSLYFKEEGDKIAARIITRNRRIHVADITLSPNNAYTRGMALTFPGWLKKQLIRAIHDSGMLPVIAWKVEFSTDGIIKNIKPIYAILDEGRLGIERWSGLYIVLPDKIDCYVIENSIARCEDIFSIFRGIASEIETPVQIYVDYMGCRKTFKSKWYDGGDKE